MISVQIKIYRTSELAFLVFFFTRHALFITRFNS